VRKNSKEQQNKAKQSKGGAFGNMESDTHRDEEQRTKKIDAASRLGVEPVGRLLWRFSLPAIAGMMVNALYNVVDRIFVGRGVADIALGGLSLVMPIMIISMAFAMLFGVGAANMISIRLGQQRRADAENALTHCFLLLAGAGAVMMVLGMIFLDPLLSLMGAQEGSQALGYARDYLRIILFGQVFGLLGFGMSHCARAQGFPMVTMIAMFMGAGINVLLDGIFIFGFHWGVEGAAWATVAAQTASSLWVLYFNFSKKAVVRIRLRILRFSWRIVAQIMSFGSAQFFLQIAVSVVALVLNICTGLYGAAALGVANGGDIALAGVTIVNSVTLLLFMPIFGINQGAQPLLGYNYGARKFARVLKAYGWAVAGATAISCVGFILIMLFPHWIVHLFAPDGGEALLDFTAWAMRVTVIMLPVTGFQIVSSNMFVVTGRPKTSIVLTLLRQIILLLPSMLIFGWLWGLHGVVAAAPFADVISVLITAALVYAELKKLRAGAKLEAAAGSG
jgi:putative MATE family efflux protein